MNRSITSTTRRRAFTLSELVVAVGLVAILTVGIGRLFSTVTRLTGTGTAIAETDALARVLETRLRQDIEGLNRLRSDQIFMVIRNTRLGGDRDFSDGNTLLNADPTQGERELYLTREDQEADLRRGVLPYSQRSRAYVARLDEIVFPTFGGDSGGFQTFQQDATGRTPVSAVHALVSYGHGLKREFNDTYDPNAIADPNNDPANLPENAFPKPVWRASGEPGFNFSRAFGQPGSRNEFAGNFSLMRQQILLYGGIAAGYPTGANRASPIGNDREYTPYIRDFGSASYFQNLGRNFGIDPTDETPGGLTDPDLPNPRARWMGRTDICAQSLSDLRRWLEGEEDLPIDPTTGNYLRINGLQVNYPEVVGPNAPNVFIPNDATAFDTGALDFDRRFLVAGDWDFRIWRQRKGDTRSPGNIPDAFRSPVRAYYQNVLNLQSALAGTLARPLYEPEPFPARRRDAGAGSSYDPTESRMDVHALLAQRCSSFEVAWSDGSTWLFDETVRVDTDGVYDSTDASSLERVLKRGDLIWFDMDFTRQDLWNVIAGITRDAGMPSDPLPLIAPNSLFSDFEDEFSPRSLELAQTLYPPPGALDNPVPDAEIGDRRGEPSTAPLYYRRASGEIEALDGGPGEPPTSGRAKRLIGFESGLNLDPVTLGSISDGSFSDPDNEFAAYSAQLTGGRLPDEGDEYLAVFGFRVPNAIRDQVDFSSVQSVDDGYSRAWPKPRFIRIRATLHDRQFRLENGRTYEFVFEISPIEEG
ncbi:MAG: hypothetical protein Tsb0013_23480 [Phycisphaerales bacterium]